MAYNYGNYSPYQQPVMYQTPVNAGGMQYGYNTQMPAMNQQMSMANQSMQQNQQQSGNQGFVWVQGEAGAKAYPVAAGNSVLLMDSESPVLYMKSTDASGRPLPMETYDLVKRDTAQAIPYSQQAQSVQMAQPQIDLSEYVKKSDLETLVTDLVNKSLA